MKKAILLVLFGVLYLQGSAAGDQGDSRWTAAQILTHYKAKNWKALSDFALEHNREILRQLQSGKQSSRLRTITAGWRWREVSSWNGKITEVRYSGKRAYAKFSERDGECYVVTMEDHRGKWYFEDIHSPSCKTFKSKNLHRK